jgi:hypothetical protein
MLTGRHNVVALTDAIGRALGGASSMTLLDKETAQ